MPEANAQGVPGGRLPAVTQTAAPVAQEIRPKVHTLPVSQATPSAHGTQLPALLHTLPNAQGVPAGSAPTSRHRGPEVYGQEISPRRHAPAT